MKNEKTVSIGDNVNIGDSVVVAQSPYSKKVGFTCGAFDLLHAGHTLMLREAREQCDYLIVGIQSDPSLDRHDKNTPIQSYEERITMVRAIRYVDEVALYDTENDLLELLEKINPDVRIVGADWREKEYTGHKLPIKVYFNKRDHEWSTSDLRERVFLAEKKKRTISPSADLHQRDRFGAT